MELQCSDCSETFTHSKRDQDFFEEKGWGHLTPKRCHACRKSARAGKKKAAIDKKKSFGKEEMKKVRKQTPRKEPVKSAARAADGRETKVFHSS